MKFTSLMTLLFLQLLQVALLATPLVVVKTQHGYILGTNGDITNTSDGRNNRPDLSAVSEIASRLNLADRVSGNCKNYGKAVTFLQVTLSPSSGNESRISGHMECLGFKSLCILHDTHTHNRFLMQKL